MKLFQWIIFFSILSGIFLLIYRRSNEKGFRKLWISLKIAVVIAATLAGLLPENAEAQEFEHFQDNNQQVTLVGRNPSETPLIIPSNGKQLGQSPANFPISPSKSDFVPSYRRAPVVRGFGGGANPGGGGNADTGDGQCPIPKEKESKKLTKTDDGSIPKSKKKKKRNEHLNRQVEVNGENYEFERPQVEKKTPSHGPDFGLEPEYDSNGNIIRDRKTNKPRSKQNKENYEQFADNLSGFIKDPKTEKIEAKYRKGRENERDVVAFINRNDKRFVIFDRNGNKYITGWKMNDLQYQEFLNNNNII